MREVTVDELRRQDLRGRFNALGNGVKLVKRRYPQIKNVVIYFQELRDVSRAAEAEAFMLEIEAEKIIYDAEVTAILEAKVERAADISQIKSDLVKIDNSDLPDWHKRILKRLVSDMK